MNFFDPMALAGGVLIGISSAWLLLSVGRIAGISGIFNGMVTAAPGDRSWRVVFIVGLVMGGVGIATFSPERLPEEGSLWQAAIAGLFVGYGTVLGNGCTSGHGICGIGRLSVRSVVATLTFIVAGMVTVWVKNRVGG